MTTKEPNLHDQGALVSAARQAASAHHKAQADRRINERGEGGTFLSKVTDEQWEWALERIANGDTDASVMRQLGVVRSTIHEKCDRDPDFYARYRRAIEIAYVNIAHDIRCVTRGEPGYSSGDVRRDEMIAKYDLELAKRFASRIVGDKLQVDQRTVTINLPGWMKDL